MTTIASPSTDYRRARSVGSAALLTAAVASTLLTILLTTLPGVTYLAETAFHGSFDAVALAQICAL
ncbi:hypothetical protein ABT116_40515, partial [Streptomyces sp. NPDC002130]|uniref:hypothetical protein n=1 Tax=Streptomyces sp. NPDC002130 TaxID=3155568 RepID=UPI0033181370